MLICSPIVPRELLHRHCYILVDKMPSHSTSIKVITFRLKEKLAYVTAVDSFDVSPYVRCSYHWDLTNALQKGIDNAFDAFPVELRNVKRECISFSVNVVVQQKSQSISIGRSAWPHVVQSLVNYEIVDVHIRPELVVETASNDTKADAPPAYSSSHSRSPSPRASPSPENASSSRVSRIFDRLLQV